MFINCVHTMNIISHFVHCILAGSEDFGVFDCMTDGLVAVSFHKSAGVADVIFFQVEVLMSLFLSTILHSRRGRSCKPFFSSHWHIAPIIVRLKNLIHYRALVTRIKASSFWLHFAISTLTYYGSHQLTIIEFVEYFLIKFNFFFII